jgi:flagellar motor switch protein FliG
MMNGKEKALMLVSILGDKSQAVLPLLSQASAHFLTSSLGNSPNLDTDVMESFLMTTLKDIDVKRQLALFETTEHDAFSEPIIEEEPISETFDNLEDDVFFEQPDPEKKPERDVSLRSAAHIARLISEQKPQIRAFFLSHLDDDFRRDILTYLSDDVIADFELRSVENIPLSHKVFESLFESLCRKHPGDDEEEADNDDDDFASFF